MAIFANANSTGYSDPVRAMSIKALEQRQKDIMAQNAAHQDDAASMATIPGGIGHVLGVVGDRMAQGRADQAVADQRQAFAKVIAAHKDGTPYNSQELAGLGMADPDFMSKVVQQQHDDQYQNRDITAQGERLDKTIAGENTRSDAAIAGRHVDVAAEQAGETARTTQREAGATGRTGMQIASTESEGEKNRADANEQQAAKFNQEEKLRGIDAEIAKATQERDIAAKSGQIDQQAAATERINSATDARKALAATQEQTFQNSQLQTKLAQDTEMQNLNRDATAARLKMQIAATSEGAKASQEAAANLADINNRATLRRQEITQAHQSELQEQAQKATAANEAAKIASQEKISGQVNAPEIAKLRDALAAGKITQADYDAASKKLLAPGAAEQNIVNKESKEAIATKSTLNTLDEAVSLMSSPKGIHAGNLSGYTQAIGEHVPQFLQGNAHLPDPETTSNTQRFNQIMNSEGLQTLMSGTKGSSSDRDVDIAFKLANDQNAPIANRIKAINTLKEKLGAFLAQNQQAITTAGGTQPALPKGATGPAPAPAPAGGRAGEVVTGITAEQALKLDAGTRYKLIDGRTGIVR
jgi:hypothetical protein